MIETVRGGQEASALPAAARRTGRIRNPRGRGVASGLLVQHRPEVERHRQRQRRRHRQPGRRLDRHRRHAHLASPCSWPRRSASRAEDVRPIVADTDTVGYTDVTGGSRVTFATGWAAYEAAQDIKRQMIARAAADLGGQAGRGRLRGRHAALQERRGEAADVQGAGRASCTRTGGTIVGRASVDPPGVGGAFATHIVDVEVDPETGKVDDPALHRRAGRRHGDPPQLRRRPDAGRRRAGHRLGAERGVLLQRPRAR